MGALDWHDARHFDRAGDKPCRWCGLPTPLRDETRRPAHKVCAELQLTPAAAPPTAPGDGARLTLPTASEPPEVSVSDWHTALATAHHAAERGLAVFPLARTKRPAIPSPHPPGREREECRAACGRFGHGVHDATTDHAVIDALFRAAPWATAYGIACGRAPHWLIGLDLDVKDGQDGIADLRRLEREHGFTMPLTATVATPSGGLHHWLTAPPGARILNSVKDLALGIDVRGPAGYLVGPGSLGTGGRYRFAPGADPGVIAEAPPELLVLLAPKPAPVHLPDQRDLTRRIHKQDAYTQRAIDGESAKVRAMTKPGGRRKRLFASAAALGRLVHAGVLPEGLAFDALLSAGLSIGLPQAECERTIHRGLARAATTPSRAA